MPRGVYQRTAEHNRANSEAAKKRGFTGVQGYCPPCQEGCTCKKHTTHAGGAKVGHEISEDTKAKIGLANSTHGYSNHEHYNRWQAMMHRCYSNTNPQYADYGGRGIRVCDEWHDTVTFCTWMDANLDSCPDLYSFDRIDNDGNYEPSNVRWADRHTQQINRR